MHPMDARRAKTWRPYSRPSSPWLLGLKPITQPAITGIGVAANPHHPDARISKAGGAKVLCHGLRNCFISVVERELMLHPSVTRRLVNHAMPNDITEGYETDCTVAQLREPAQKVADHIYALMHGLVPAADAA